MTVNVTIRSACPFCHQEGHIIHRALEDRLFRVPGRWNFRQCDDQECGLVWLDPMPERPDVVKLYENYYTHRSSGRAEQNNLWHGIGRAGLKLVYSLIKRTYNLKNQRRRLNDMFLGSGGSGRKLLEVGCGNGTRLHSLKGKGWQVTGQEIDIQAATQARQLYDIDVHLGDLLDIGFEGASFDAIVMNHVVEHVYDPVATLVECRRLLTPEGKIVIITPNIKSYGHEIYSGNWRGLEPPRHLHLFSDQSATRLMHMAGFEQFDVRTSAARAAACSHGSIDLALYGFHAMGQRPRLNVFARQIAFQRKAMRVWSRKPNSGEELIIRALNTARQ